MKLFVNRRTLIILYVVYIFFLVSGCTETKGNIDELEAEISHLQNKVGELEAEIAKMEKQDSGFSVDYEDHYETLLRELFSEDELIKLASERGMVYQLKVNQASVTEPEVIVTAGEMISITVSEGMVMHSDDYNTLLPNKILQQVMLDDLANHIEIVESDVDFFNSPSAGTITWGYGFFFENATAGSAIKVRISEALRERLGLHFCDFTVGVK